METFKLNNGMSIPALGFGVYLMKPEECEPALREALKDGYRLIDTANAYFNERAVGRAIKASGLKREDIFLTTKIWPSEYGYAKTKKAIAETLARLDTPYIDLLLLHQSFGDYLGAWKALEEAVASGQVKAIGISNFTVDRFLDLLKHASIVPAVSQDEYHPYYTEPELKKAFAPYHIVMESWYPLGHGDPKMLNEPLFLKLAAQYHKSPAQIILRWHIQQGNVVLPKSLNPVHILENLNVFDFKLASSEMKAIASLDAHTPYFRVGDKANEARMSQWQPDFNQQK